MAPIPGSRWWRHQAASFLPHMPGTGQFVSGNSSGQKAMLSVSYHEEKSDVQCLAGYQWVMSAMGRCGRPVVRCLCGQNCHRPLIVLTWKAQVTKNHLPFQRQRCFCVAGTKAFGRQHIAWQKILTDFDGFGFGTCKAVIRFIQPKPHGWWYWLLGWNHCRAAAELGIWGMGQSRAPENCKKQKETKCSKWSLHCTVLVFHPYPSDIIWWYLKFNSLTKSWNVGVSENGVVPSEQK